MNEFMMHTLAQQYGITKFPEETPIAMAYIPYQINGYENIYSAEKGICTGTMFPELDKPFNPSRCGGTQRCTVVK